MKQKVKSVPVIVALGLLGVIFGALRSDAGSPGDERKTDKTLVSWITLANRTQQGGSTLTIQRGDQFDGIVFGERTAGKWMAGSDTFKRTQNDQRSSATENAADQTLIQMAIVYRANQISLYRDGEPYAEYAADNIDLLSAADNLAVFGLRHQGANSGQTFQGSIEDARIYDRSLTPGELKHLRPNLPSELRPYAWWTFEKDKETDQAGRFPVNVLMGGAKIENGRLWLPAEGATLIAAAKMVTLEPSSLGRNTPSVEAYRSFRQKLLADRTRPAYHLVSPEGKASPGDPNGAIYWKGRYHLHFIFPGGYAHVSSLDMVHWRWHPMTRIGTGGMNSGGCFLDKNGIPTMIYNDYGAGKNVVAFAVDDDLEKWTETYPIEPALRPNQDHGKISVWDPDGWLEGDTYYALFGNHPYQIGKEATVMKSKDLKHWEYVGPFLSHEMPDVTRSTDAKTNEDISCPNFFKLGSRWMLLCISHIKGCRYYLGDWKDEMFHPSYHARMNWCRAEGMKDGAHGGEYFAPESLLTPDGRRVMWAWCFAASTNGGNSLWDGIQSLPRELSLPPDGILRLKPLRELEQLRYHPLQAEYLTVESGTPLRLKEIAGDLLELMATIKPGTALRYGVRVLCDKNNGQGLDLVVDPGNKSIRVGTTTAPFELNAGEDIQLRIFIDRRVVEVFANDRQALVKQHDYAPDDVGICFFSEGGGMEIKQVKSWKMQPSNAW